MDGFITNFVGLLFVVAIVIAGGGMFVGIAIAIFASLAKGAILAIGCIALMAAGITVMDNLS